MPSVPFCDLYEMDHQTPKHHGPFSCQNKGHVWAPGDCTQKISRLKFGVYGDVRHSEELLGTASKRLGPPSFFKNEGTLVEESRLIECTLSA